MLLLSQDSTFLCNLENVRGLSVSFNQGSNTYLIYLNKNNDERGKIMGKYSSLDEAKNELNRIATYSTWKQLYKMGSEKE